MEENTQNRQILDLSASNIQKLLRDGMLINESSVEKLKQSNEKLKEDFFELEKDLVRIEDIYDRILLSGSLNVGDIDTLTLFIDPFRFVSILRVLKNMCDWASTGDSVLSRVKEFYESLRSLINVYNTNKALFDGVDIKSVLKQAYCNVNYKLGFLLESIDQEATLLKKSIDGIVVNCKQMLHEEMPLFSEKEDTGVEPEGTVHWTEWGFKFSSSPKQNKGDNEDDEDEDIGYQLYSKYYFTTNQFDGYMRRVEELANERFKISRAISELGDFSFLQLTEHLSWLMNRINEELFNKSSEKDIENLISRYVRMSCVKGVDLFKEELLCDIYPILAGKVFDIDNFSNFVASMNNPQPPIFITVKNGQIKKACYLIDWLSGALPYDKKDIWAKTIIKALKIKENTYWSKRRECVGCNCTADDAEYVEKLKAVGRKYGLNAD